MYVKINGDDTKYFVSLTTFTTQHGFDAVRFIGDEIPNEDNDGFKMYNDDDTIMSDLSAYKYAYRQNEFSVEKDIIVPPKGSDAPLPPSSYDILSRRVSKINSQVVAITPYEKTQKAYYNEIEKAFYGVPQGNVSVFFDNYEGEYSIERNEGRVVVKFPERLNTITNVTIMVQN